MKDDAMMRFEFLAGANFEEMRLVFDIDGKRKVLILNGIHGVGRNCAMSRLRICRALSGDAWRG